MSDVNDRLAGLRDRMAARGLDGYLVPSADPHQSEYPPACWRRREWLSGFTGSVADAVVSRTRAWLRTDSRYWLQAEAELDPECFELERARVSGVAALAEWLATLFADGEVVGVDPRLLDVARERSLRDALEASGAALELVDENLVDAVRGGAPQLPRDPLRVQARRFSGSSPNEKLEALRAALAESRADAHVVTMLDAVAWLLDLRGSDVDFNPLAIAYCLVTAESTALFVDEAKLGPGLVQHLGEEVEIRPYEALGAALDELARGGGMVWIDPDTCSAWIAARLREGGARLHEARSPISLLKARKNAAEIAGARACHLRDGVAMTRFLRWLERGVSEGSPISEIDAARKLAAFRAAEDDFQGLSFESISAFGDHGAIVHYRPAEEGDRIIDASSLYLIDSGGQYLDGTTDITRTLCFGEPTSEQIAGFTRVLRGHVSLAMASFPQGTTGAQLDTLARRPLWDAGLSFGHGTGHGVGAHLCVHEGPASIAPRAPHVPLEAGMILSNEPGWYAAGRFGIRIENLVLVVPREDLGTAEEPFLGFETLTLSPIQRRLIDPGLLLKEELAWLDAYHARVRRELVPRLEDEDAAWLERETEPIGEAGDA